MGVEMLVGLGVAASIGGDVAAASEQSAANQAKQNQLQLQMSQEKSKAAQDQITRDEKEQQISSTSRAMAAVRGESLTSGSYNTLQEASYNSFAQDTNISNINLQANEAQINEEMAASESQYHSQLFGDVLSGIGSFSNLASIGGSKKESDSNDGQDEDQDEDNQPYRRY